MNDLQRTLLLSLGTLALVLLCLPACTEAQPMGWFPDPSFDGDDEVRNVPMSRQQLLRRLSDLTMSRSGTGPGYTMPRKRQSTSSTSRLHLFPLDRVVLTLQDMARGEYIDRMEENERAMENAGRRRR